MSELFTVKEVAEKLKLSQMTIRRLEQRGDLQSVRIGDSIRFSQKAVDALLRKCAK